MKSITVHKFVNTIANDVRVLTVLQYVYSTDEVFKFTVYSI